MRVIVIFSIVILAPSCGMIKNVAKHRSKSTSQTDSAAMSHVDAIQQERVEKITETMISVDTIVTIKGSTLEGSKPIKDLAGHPLELEDDTQMVTVELDGNGNINVKSTTKGKTIPLRYRKHIQEKVLSDRKSRARTDSQVTSNTSTRSDKTIASKNVKRWGVPWYLGVLIVFALLIALYLTLRKRVGWFL